MTLDLHDRAGLAADTRKLIGLDPTTYLRPSRLLRLCGADVVEGGCSLCGGAMLPDPLVIEARGATDVDRESNLSHEAGHLVADLSGVRVTERDATLLGGSLHLPRELLRAWTRHQLHLPWLLGSCGLRHPLVLARLVEELRCVAVTRIRGRRVVYAPADLRADWRRAGRIERDTVAMASASSLRAHRALCGALAWEMGAEPNTWSIFVADALALDWLLPELEREPWSDTPANTNDAPGEPFQLRLFSCG